MKEIIEKKIIANAEAVYYFKNFSHYFINNGDSLLSLTVSPSGIR